MLLDIIGTFTKYLKWLNILGKIIIISFIKYNLLHTIKLNVQFLNLIFLIDENIKILKVEFWKTEFFELQFIVFFLSDHSLNEIIFL